VGRAGAAGAGLPADGPRGVRPRAALEGTGPGAADRDRPDQEGAPGGRDHRDRLLPAAPATGQAIEASRRHIMARVVSVHSFRGGTGKSNVTANLATTIARRGQRVGIV